MTQFFSHNKKCARCPRIDSRQITFDEAVELHKSAEKAKLPMAAAVFLAADGTVIRKEFGELCSVCQSIVAGYMDAAFKQLQKVSSDRDKGVLEVEPDEE